MPSTFIERLAGDAQLTDVERGVLRQAGVRSADDVDALVKAFPSIVDAGVRLDVVSNAVAQQISAAYASVYSNFTAQLPQAGLGANPPPGALSPAAWLWGLHLHRHSHRRQRQR